MAVLARPLLDHAVAFANFLFVFGRAPAQPEPQYVTVTDGRGTAIRRRISKLRTFARGEQRTLAGLPGHAESELGFVAAVVLSDLLGLRLFDGRLTVAVENAGGVVASGTLPVELAAANGVVSPASLHLDLAAELGLADRRLVELMRTGGVPAPGAPEHAVDIAGRSNSGFVVEGWIANARNHAHSFLSADGLVFIPASEVIYKARPDVSEHLRRQKHAIATEDHGVLLSFPQTLAGTDSFLALREEVDAFAPVAQIKLAFSDGRDRLLELVSHAVGNGKFPRPAQARRFYLPFFTEHKPAEEFSVNWVRLDEAEPRVSVIVPLYREYRFIFSLVTMQKRFPPDYEWLFVSDDPTQHQVLTRILERRSDGLAGSTALITNRFNYGYARSNNLGASVARGKTLLFMNSDIWVDTAQPIEDAAKMLEEKRYGVLGFRLLYEDGTIQHDGMTFRASQLMHNLLLVDHPGKGTPPDEGVGTAAEVPAVTGALMMIGKDLFERAGQFDKSYIKGDFEDADLCLKVRAQGGRVGLMKTNDIYHLERQSIRLMGSESGRLALTYLNCITFNERWGRHLAPRAEPKEAPVAAATSLAPPPATQTAPKKRSRAG